MHIQAHSEKNPSIALRADLFPLALRIGFWLCIVIAIAAVVRRLLALAYPSRSGPPQIEHMDALFTSHAALTLAHIVPALAFVLLLPFMYFPLRSCGIAAAVHLSAGRHRRPHGVCDEFVLFRRN